MPAFFALRTGERRYKFYFHCYQAGICLRSCIRMIRTKMQKRNVVVQSHRFEYQMLADRVAKNFVGPTIPLRSQVVSQVELELPPSQDG